MYNQSALKEVYFVIKRREKMTILELENLIKEKHYDLRALCIGSSPNYDERFNLLIREDGKYEIFYGEHGQKSNPRVYDNEEEAADAFYEIVKRDIPRTLFPQRKDPGKLTLSERFDGAVQNRKSTDKIILGMIIFCLMIGIFFTIVMIAVQRIDIWFFCWIVWDVIFTILTFLWIRKVRA